MLSKLPVRHFGGGGLRVLYFWKHLDKDRFRQLIVLVDDVDKEARDDGGSLYSQFVDAGTSLVAIGSQRSSRRKTLRLLAAFSYIVSFPYRLVKLLMLMRRYDTHVIDAHSGPNAGILGCCAALLSRCPMILTVYHPPSDRRGRVLGRIIGRRSNLVITDSEIRKKEICEWLDLHPSRVAVIPSAVVAPEATRSVNEVYEHFGLVPDANRTIVGQIARLLPFKGQMVLLEAAASVLLEFPNTMFLIVGYGTSAGKGFPSQLATRAEELGIQNQVRICSYSGSIGDVWQVIDIHAHASLFDSLPVSILEGMSLGKPAIVTATGGVQQLVADGTTGIVVEAGNAEALTKGMIALLREPQMAKRLGVAAKERFNSLYNPEHLTRNLENVLQEVCGSCNKKNIP